MNTATPLQHNRVILCHFDSYSCALNFARYGDSILTPAPLAEATMIEAPDTNPEQHAPDAVLDAVIAQYGLDPRQVQVDAEFEAWLGSDGGPVRVHLVRFNTPDIPHAAIETSGGVFKSLSQMRGLPALELNLMRQVYNQFMGG